MVDGEARDHWANDLEFVMSCIALSIGLGNVWRFPFVALENGGGAFLIPYLVVLFLIGQPVYYLELLMGQFGSRGSIKMYDIVPAMRGIGFGQSYSVAACATYYSALVALTVRFFVDSFSSELPWSYCREEWETGCISSANVSSRSVNNFRTSSELYFYRTVLHEVDNLDHGIGLPDWRLVLCLGFSWLCVVVILYRGIESSGKASYFLALFPYLMMLVLLIRAVSLPGSGKGILHLITPQWRELLNVDVWFAAVTQVFYSMGIFLGEIITYGSYSRYGQRIFKVAVAITFVDTITSLTSGIIIFGILGNLAHELGVDNIEDVVKGGTGLAFVSYPDAIAKFSWVPQLFSAFFFGMLFIIGAGCVVGQQACLMASIQDWFGKMNKLKLISALASVQFLIGLLYVTPAGQYLVNLVDFHCISMLIYVLAIAQLATLSWIYGVKSICRDVEFMLGSSPHMYLRISWGIITPFMMILIFVYSMIKWSPQTYNDHEFPLTYSAIGWVLTGVGLIQLPAWFAFAVYKQRGQLTWRQTLARTFQPMDSWGPTDEKLFGEYKVFLVNCEKRQSKPTASMGPFTRVVDQLFGT